MAPSKKIQLPAQKGPIPATTSTADKRAGEDLFAPPKVRKSSRTVGIQLVQQPEPALAVKPTRTCCTRAQIDADNLVKEEKKVKIAAGKEAVKAKTVQHLVALHLPANVLNRTPRPSAQDFKAREARRQSHSDSLYFVEDETPMVLQTSFKRANTHSNDKAHNPTPFKRVKPPAEDVEIVETSYCGDLQGCCHAR